ncbi:MAG: hypothetical protein PUC65_16070 [Clostridiales bacterium]|nr:hypothetical protein [Clostridiales bacterium]
MKIIFFSKEGDCGVTSNMSAISIAGILEYQMRILTLENHWCHDGIAQYLMYENRSKMVKEGEVYYLDHDFDVSLVLHFARRTKKRKTDIMTIEVIQNSLYYMPQNAYSKEVFDYEFYYNVIPRLIYLENAYEYIFIDTKNYTLNSRVLLDDADLVVVNLKQDYDEIKSFFTNYSSLAYKSLFLISDYQPNQSWTVTKIKNEFHIPKNRIIPIYHNQQFQNAILNGKVINYMYDNYTCDKTNPNYTFIREIKKATKMLVTMAQESKQSLEEQMNVNEK